MKIKLLKFLSTADFLEESQAINLIYVAATSICFLLLILVIWSAFVELDETSVTQGKVIPQGNIHIMQHLEGGIVSKVKVRNGDRVQQGQVMVELSDKMALSELQQMQSREASILLDLARLKLSVAEKSNIDEHFKNSLSESQYAQHRNKKKIHQLIENDKLLLKLQNQFHLDQLELYKAQIKQREIQADQLKAQKEVVLKHLKLLEEERGIYDKLAKKNMIPKVDYLAVLRELNATHGNLAKVMSQQQQNLSALSEARFKLSEFISNKHKTTIQDMGELQAELIQVQHALERIYDKVQRLSITAPMKGIVTGLEVHPGSVVSPGKTILELVPTTKPLVIETHINPKDIGHVAINDKVKVKITTYDFVTYGAIPGKLTDISASTYLDEQGNSYYRGIIKISHDYVGKDPSRNRLLPGMNVQADIITGHKSLLNYLLKPLHRSASSAFAER